MSVISRNSTFPQHTYPYRLPVALGSFREDVDKLCEAGVNFFVFHCVAHQDRDDRPMTMGPFGTRFDRLHADVDSVRILTDYIRYRIDLQKKKAAFDFHFGEEGERAYIRLPRGHKEVKAVLYCHQNMTEEVLFRSDLFCRRMDRPETSVDRYNHMCGSGWGRKI